MVDKILKYLFASEQNAHDMSVYVCATIKQSSEYEVAQIIIDLHSDDERLTKIIEYFKIY